MELCFSGELRLKNQRLGSNNGILTIIIFLFFSIFSESAFADPTSKQKWDIELLAQSIKIGPEFEFEPSTQSVNSYQEQRNYVDSVRQLLEMRLSAFSYSFLPQQSQGSTRFFLRSDIYPGVHYQYVDFHVHNFTSNGIEDGLRFPIVKMPYYSLSFYPKDDLDQALPEIHISYTRDDVLFEVHVRPLTTSEYRLSSPILEQFIFATMREAGLQPPKNGGGHLHLGLQGLEQAFSGNKSIFHRAIFNFMVVMLSSGEFVGRFMRPHRNFAIHPSSTTVKGVDLSRRALHNWRSEVEGEKWRQSPDIKDWLLNHFNEVTLLNFLSEIDLADDLASFQYFSNQGQAASEGGRFMIEPNKSQMLYPAFRYNDDLHTIEIRALRSQKSIYEFVVLGEFFTQLIAGSSHVPLQYEDVSLVNSGVLGEIPANRLVRQTLKLFELAHIRTHEKRRTIIGAFQTCD